MNKKCYTLTYLGLNANGGRHFRINCQIWLNSTGSVSSAELLAFQTYILAQINRVWTSSNNPGLGTSASGTVFNSSLDSITCAPGTGVNGDTGVVIGLWADRVAGSADPIITSPNLQQGEILFNVSRFPGPGQRPNMNADTQIGQLFYLQDRVLGTPPTYPDADRYHNTAAHEFGHALGLNDRYHFMTNGKTTNFVANFDSDSNFICEDGGGDAPMYLPGLYDPTISYDPGSFVEMEPDYNQMPHNIVTGNTPQPNYDSPSDAGSSGVYDIEYNSNFMWLHNLYSRSSAPNNPFGTGHALGTSTDTDPTSLLYRQIFSDDFTDPQEMVGITRVQLDVVLSLSEDPDSLVIGQVYESNKTETEMAVDRGFSARIFDQYIFIMYASQRGSGCSPKLPLTILPPDGVDRGRPIRPINSPNLFFTKPIPIDAPPGYRPSANATFVGLSYFEDELDRNGEGAYVVSDLKFATNDINLKIGNIGRLGIHDIMSYRMSKFNDANNEWSLQTVRQDDNVGYLVGFFNPHLAANRAPTSVSITSAINTSLIKPPYFGVGFTTQDSIASYGNPLGPYFIRAVNRISGGANSITAFGPNLQKYVSKEYQFELTAYNDLFEHVGIGNFKGRHIWNGWSWQAPGIVAPSILAPGFTLNWTVSNSSGRAQVQANLTFPDTATGVQNTYILFAPYYANRRVMMILGQPT